MAVLGSPREGSVPQLTSSIMAWGWEGVYYSQVGVNLSTFCGSFGDAMERALGVAPAPPNAPAAQNIVFFLGVESLGGLL